NYHLSPDRWGQNPQTCQYCQTGTRPNILYGPLNGSLPLKRATEPAAYPIETNLIYGIRLNYLRLERPRLAVVTRLEDLSRFETTKILPLKDIYTSLSNLVLLLLKIFSKMLLTVYRHVMILLALLLVSTSSHVRSRIIYSFS
ncbi:hypothetical protein L209DRAFT_793537, partial [Thermothelomyces heterothallicus CBS 203.75]